MLIFGLFLSDAHAIENLKVSVNFDSQAYSIEFDPKVVRYNSNQLQFEIVRKACNEKIVERLQSRTMAAFVAPNFSDRATPEAVKVEKANRTAVYVPRGSSVGTWLRDVPRVFSYEVAEAEMRCRRK